MHTINIMTPWSIKMHAFLCIRIAVHFLKQWRTARVFYKLFILQWSECVHILKKWKKKIQFQKSWIKWLDSPLLMFSPLIIESESESHSVVSDSFRPHGLYRPWNSPGQNTGVGSLSLLQGIFPTQGLNPGLLPCRWILYQLSHQGSPRILEWVAYPFSSGSWVSCFAGGFFTNSAIREALLLLSPS